MPAFIGIDLGTTYSAVAHIDETGRPVIVHNKDGGNVTPSCVLVKSDGVAEVGEEARRTWGLDPNVVARFKREMGSSKTYSAGGTQLTPADLSSLVLKKLASDASIIIGEIGEAVVTIPANFSHEAREATMSAAKAAGLNIKFIINEPTAAALYYAFKSGDELHGHYAVYDLGGGTFDISVINVNGQNIDVIATNGLAKLGGDDFDGAIQKLVQEKFKALYGESLDPEDFTKVDAEEQKKSLSKRDKVSFRVARKVLELSRSEFEEAISTLIAQTEMLCETTLDEAKIEAHQLQGIFLVGGSTRIPMVQKSVSALFKREPTSSVNVDEVVALGAALYAAYKGDRSNLSATQSNAIGKIKVNESTSKCFGTISIGVNRETQLEQLQNSIIISKGSAIPCQVTESFYTRVEGQVMVDCQVTESTAAESDPRFVKVIWEGTLELPPNRPAQQEIAITYEYDENQIMKCSFVDVATSKKTTIDLSMTNGSNDHSSTIDKFMVE